MDTLHPLELGSDHVNFADPPLKRQNANYARTHKLRTFLFCTFWRDFEMALSLLKLGPKLFGSMENLIADMQHC